MDLSAIIPSFFSSSPTFKDFIVSSLHAEEGDQLIVRGGNVLKINNKFDQGHSEKETNKKTWKAFSRAVKREFTETKIQEISNCYNFNFENLAHSALPLDPRYVEYFGAGAANTYTGDLKEALDNRSWLEWDLRGRSVGEIANLYADVTRNQYFGKIEDPRTISGAPRKTHELVIQDNLETHRQRANLVSGIQNLTSQDHNIPRMHPCYCRLSMALTSLLGTKDVGLVIPVPGAQPGEVDFYQVYDVISAEGLTAVALVPVSDSSYLQPIISFRCTKQSFGQTDALPSWLNDMEKHIGKSGYEACKAGLNQLMEDASFTRGKKVKVCSYSLGGAHAGYFMQDHWREVDEFIGFNSVGNDARVIENIADQINELASNEVPPTIYHYRNKGDWVNEIGRQHMGCGIKHPNGIVQIVESIIDNFPAPTENIYDSAQVMAWLNLHAVRPLDSLRKYKYKIYRGLASCNPILDTYNRDGTLENQRQFLGHKILYNLISFVYKTSDFILRLFGIEFFKRNLR